MKSTLDLIEVQERLFTEALCASKAIRKQLDKQVIGLIYRVMYLETKLANCRDVHATCKRFWNQYMRKYKVQLSKKDLQKKREELRSKYGRI